MNGVTYIERVDEKTGLIYSIPFVYETTPLRRVDVDFHEA